ncbi:type I restriction endonuclease subunit S [Tenacibaculum finnmarkense genomovar ulcerans]|uniref:restriction endonuclease subunit S n=1 Tax=Tenacibaculum finnmarkense TaxID=2781243 RepID=UPI00187B9EBC|nr:restriction endonuclease subunit S [Tenacibaculum finnmarkense]MBE7687452.1 type I restriction endonuclease subunit S [Tenacibaculum finnmarkense genomovar ulcerans]
MESKLPKNWERVYFTEIFDINGGTQPPKSQFINESKEGYIRLLQIRDFGKKPVPTYIPDTGKLRTCKKDDILIARYGASIGRIVSNQEGAYNVALAKVNIPNVINKNFVKWLLKSHIFQNKIISFQRTAQSGFNKNDLSSIKIPLPPLAEQQRIVTKLDTLFGSLDALKIRLNNIPQLIKNFKQAVLTQAVTGKLTQEWRVGKELEYASLLNKNNQVEFEIINFDFLPNNWLKTALGNYANCSRGKFSVRPRNDPRYFDGNYPFMQIGDLPREGGYTSDYSKTLNEEGIKVSKSFPKGTVVVAIVGATIGLTGILEKEMFFPDSLIGLNCENFISNQYLEYYLRLCKNGFREISYAGGGQPNIKLPTIKNLELLIPPLKEQTEIVKRVENLFSKADAIEKQYKTLKEKINRLPQAILAKAFKGELVAQLPTDGDAKDLLEEIKKLKESLVVKPKKKVVRNKK